MIKSAIVTTLIKSNHVLDSFITYHQQIGFDFLFLFFDDPQEMEQFDLSKYKNVIAVPNDHTLQEKWKRTRVFSEKKDLAAYLSSEHYARQIVNVEIALDMCIQHRIDWLLHIDADELFYSPDGPVNEHFLKFSEMGVKNISYINHEAASVNSWVNDYFREVTLFKKNPSVLSRYQHKYIRSHSRFQDADSYFLYYQNGKSAAKVSPELRPRDVHSFYSAESAFHCTSSVILHYPVCGFDNFYQKYRILGAFSDNYCGIFPIGVPFHLQARDVFRGGDLKEIRKFYEEKILYSDSAENGELLKQEILCLIDFPSKILSVK